MSLLLLVGVALAGDTETVELSGELENQQGGRVRVELLVPQEGVNGPLLVWHGFVEAPGPFSFEVPANLGTVKLRAAVDLKRDGVGPDDPQMRLPIRLEIGEGAVSALRLVILPPEHSSPSLPTTAPPPPRK